MLTSLKYVGEVSLIFFKSLSFIFRGKIHLKQTVLQMSHIGVNSIPIVCLTVGFTGMVIALQTAHTAVRFGAGKFVGWAVAVSMARELAPVLTGVVVAGRAGSAITAELASMKVTEQVDALSAMGIHPVRYLVVPRLLASLVMIPILALIANLVGNAGGFFVAVTYAGVNPKDYLWSATTFLKLSELIDSLIKAGVFGLIICMVACHQGLNTTGGAAGVGKSTTACVVLSMIFIFMVNYFLSLLMFGNVKL